MSSKYRIVRRWDANAEPEQIKIIHRPAKDVGKAEETAAPKEEQPSQHVLELSEEELHSLQKLAACYNSSLEYLTAKQRPWRYVWLNLFLGMAKGFGVAIGITILAFLALKILTSLQILNLPIIGDFVAELIDYINNIRGFGK